MKLSFARNIIVLFLSAAGANVNAAQSVSTADPAPGYPARPIRMIVPFPPGGSNDIMGRYFAQYLTERLGRHVVLDNRPGADGIIGTEIVARAPPDGYTLLVASAAHAVNGGTRKLPYDPLNSFVWAGTLGLGPSVLCVNTAVPANSLKELIAHGKANPGKLVLSTSGGYAQFSSELFHHMSGMKLIVVVYKGGFPALIDAMAGQAQINMGSLIQTIPHFRSGKIKALATTGAKRAAPTPELPTIAEAGIPGYEANNWWAVGAPAGTPAGIITKLNMEMARYLKLPETTKRFETEGVEADFRTPDEVKKFLPVEMAKWANVAKVANIRTQ
jgi:tripartite-type tricarboxylate transporter receptor subunit TctC